MSAEAYLGCIRGKRQFVATKEANEHRMSGSGMQSKHVSKSAVKRNDAHPAVDRGMNIKM